MSAMARKKKTEPVPASMPPQDQQMPQIIEKASKGSQHRPRVMVALRPAVYELLASYAKKTRRAASWELHNLLLEAFVSKGEITQDEADALWDDVIRKQSD
jgi:hypothetical protein